MTADLAQRLRELRSQKERDDEWHHEVDYEMDEAADALDATARIRGLDIKYVEGLEQRIKELEAVHGIEARVLARLAAAEAERDSLRRRLELAEAALRQDRTRLAAAERVVAAARECQGRLTAALLDYNAVAYDAADLGVRGVVSEENPLLNLDPADPNSNDAGWGTPDLNSVGFEGDPQSPSELMKQTQRATEGGPHDE
jgi:hypothetical protein